MIMSNHKLGCIREQGSSEKLCKGHFYTVYFANRNIAIVDNAVGAIQTEQSNMLNIQAAYSGTEYF